MPLMCYHLLASPRFGSSLRLPERSVQQPLAGALVPPEGQPAAPPQGPRRPEEPHRLAAPARLRGQPGPGPEAPVCLPPAPQQSGSGRAGGEHRATSKKKKHAMLVFKRNNMSACPCFPCPLPCHASDSLNPDLCLSLFSGPPPASFFSLRPFADWSHARHASWRCLTCLLLSSGLLLRDDGPLAGRPPGRDWLHHRPGHSALRLH